MLVNFEVAHPMIFSIQFPLASKIPNCMISNAKHARPRQEACRAALKIVVSLCRCCVSGRSSLRQNLCVRSFKRYGTDLIAETGSATSLPLAPMRRAKGFETRAFLLYSSRRSASKVLFRMSRRRSRWCDRQRRMTLLLSLGPCRARHSRSGRRLQTR